MADKPRYKRSQIEQALRAAYGNVTVAAGKLGVDRVTIYNYIKRYPDLEDVLDDARRGLVVLAEVAIGQMITEKQPAAVIFTLKTQGRSRGWIERIETHEVTSAEIDAEIERELARMGHSRKAKVSGNAESEADS